MQNDETYAERRQRKIFFAKALRKRMTVSERTLWNELREEAMLGWKFRRQVAIDRFIVDFLCFKCRLVLEVDGPIHRTQREYDAERERFLRHLGFRILRFTNDEVDHHLNDVLDRIRQALPPLPGGKREAGEGTGVREVCRTRERGQG